MDISSPSLAPRVVADLRPTADAAAIGRAKAPPLAVAQGPAVPPASSGQEALVVRGLLGAGSVPSVGQPDPAGAAPDATRTKAPARVLKPWGVPMLPSEERRQREASDACRAGTGDATGEVTGLGEAAGDPARSRPEDGPFG